MPTFGHADSGSEEETVLLIQFKLAVASRQINLISSLII